MIRPAMSYGVPLWHKLLNVDKPPKGPAAKFRIHQNQGLRRVIGAFRATLVQQLETKAVSPLDL
jgi:hypothetical protein